MAASALAASCAAIVASYLGIAGTISGAAIGSIVATTGSAFYGHAFQTSSKKIVKRLGPNTFLVSDPKPKASTTAQAGQAVASEPTEPAAPNRPPEPKRGFGYSEAATLAAALLVVFGAAITVGLLAGGPIRQSGTGTNVPSLQTTTRLPTATRSAGSGTASTTATTSASASASVSPTGSADTAPSSDSGTASPPAAGLISP